MPLADWQAALGMMIATRAAAGEQIVSFSFDTLQLSSDDRNWLASLPTAAGFRVTCAIQRWWRETRLRSLARLTIAALGADQSAQMMSEYLRVNLCSSLFFLPETLAFLQFVADHSTHPHHRAIAQFERALLLAREAAEVANSHEPYELLIEFAGPPGELLAAILSGQALPAASTERFWVLVSSQLPAIWRVASEEEARAELKQIIPARV